MLKILHTADWHIGKVLHLFDLEEDHRLFFDWMIQLIKSESVDVLIVAGDIFDHNNPSNESRKSYYDLLKELAQLNIRIIIVGGNHDSINMLHAAKELLGLLNVTVLAGLPDNHNDQILPLYDQSGQIVAVCGAVPFLRDKDLRQYVASESTEQRINATRQAIIQHYKELKESIRSKYNTDIPIIATGHLYIQGASMSEAERDIHIGHQAGIEANQLSDLFDYLALGHIHRASRYGKGNMRYSGSPIPLSFSEKEDEKIVVIVTVEEGKVTASSVAVPVFRRMIKYSGSWENIKSKMTLMDNKNPLPPIIELEIHEEVTAIPEIEREISLLKLQGMLVIKQRYIASQSYQPIGTSSAYQQNISDLMPLEVFNRKLNESNLDQDTQRLLKDAFVQLLEEVQNDDDL